jgi:hypothetical protein
MKLLKSPAKEISRPQVEQIINLIHDGDIYRESGGMVYQDGRVTRENNPGICGSVLILDWESYPWDKIAALWVGMELPKPEGYEDECCGRCLTAKEAAIKVPPLDFVTEGMGGWANAFGVPVVAYQPKSATELGYFDYYDPTGETIGVNFYPESPRAGICRKDPKQLTASARQTMHFIKQREAAIAEEWEKLAREYSYQESRCIAAAEQTLKTFEPLTIKYANAVEKIKHYTGQTPSQPNYQNWKNVRVVSGLNPQYEAQRVMQANQQAQIKNYLLSASTDPFEFPNAQPEKMGIPIQAYSRWKN